MGFSLSMEMWFACLHSLEEQEKKIAMAADPCQLAWQVKQFDS
jgi:hypothetical protein